MPQLDGCVAAERLEGLYRLSIVTGHMWILLAGLSTYLQDGGTRAVMVSKGRGKSSLSRWSNWVVPVLQRHEGAAAPRLQRYLCPQARASACHSRLSKPMAASPLQHMNIMRV